MDSGVCSRQRRGKTQKKAEVARKTTENHPCTRFFRTKIRYFAKKVREIFAGSKKHRTFALAITTERRESTQNWSLRLSVRTRHFHSLKRSSTLLGTTQ